ncbi:hypothetical protein [Clostridium novyi]|uniref:hypothetical protein n=1 Tax=Clostridium novyi TaxID=1542 RepID=UPI0004D98934|nr:hypothetical protein [Clostridium novyi]KEI12753.1 hypothetical protein Z958_05590 [Clostridium novyi B str. NCTC 9691]
MKDVMILSYEGNVRINDAPNNATQSDIIEVARKVLEEVLNNRYEDRAEPLMRLSNIEYLTEKEMYEHLHKLEEMGIKEECITVDWEDYK